MANSGIYYSVSTMTQNNPVSKKTVKKTDVVRSVLKRIDEVLARDDSDSEALWNILTALRGPDSDEWELKAATTERIRTVALPKTAYSNFTASTASFSKGKIDKSILPDDHFGNHVRMAITALQGHGFDV
jgi:hypothetical protein